MLRIDRQRAPNPLFRLLPVLANETGHPVESLRHLRWSDVDFDSGVITWRAQHNELGMQHETPLSAMALEALRDEPQRCPAIGDNWMFAAPERPAEPVSRHLPKLWWKRCCESRLAQDEGASAGASLQRQFATELKDAPMKHLAQLGGWKDPQTNPQVLSAAGARANARGARTAQTAHDCGQIAERTVGTDSSGRRRGITMPRQGSQASAGHQHSRGGSWTRDPTIMNRSAGNAARRILHVISTT